MKVAVAQIEAQGLDLEGNISRTCAAVAEAAGQGAGLVVLPETVTTGWVLDPPAIGSLAENGDGSGPALSAWRNAARTHGTAIIGGYAERDGDRLYNSVAVIDRHGEIIGGYRKLHLFAREGEMFRRGDLGLPLFEIEGVSVGVLVCYDLRFPEAMRLLALRGAQLIAVPTAWVVGYDPKNTPDGSRIGQVEGALVQANLNQVYVACADLSGSIRDVQFLGRSLIASPYGEPLIGPLPAIGEDIALAEVDPQETERALDRGEGITPRKDRRTDVYSLGPATAPGSASEDGTVPDGPTLLAQMQEKRGYVLDIHRTLAARDPAFLVAYERFLEASFLEERSLDRRTKELVYVGVLMALGTPDAHLAAHMRAAVEHGATEAEVLEVLEQVLPPAGVPRFIEAMRTFEETFAPEVVS